MRVEENKKIELLDVGKKWLKKTIKFLKIQVNDENVLRTITLFICGIVFIICINEHNYLFAFWVLTSTAWIYYAFKSEKDAKRWERKYNILKYRGEIHE